MMLDNVVNDVVRCTTCLNMSTRPRISFDEFGRCNACQWVEEKKSLDWNSRHVELQALLESVKSKSTFNCVVPVSGGKDGSYVAHQLKHKYGVNPLCVTVRPPLEIDLGSKNLKNFIDSGYAHIHVSPCPDVMQKLNKLGFIHKGFPYYGWLIAIMTGVIRVAISMNIPLIFYGESGEVEYGGSTETKNTAIYNIEYMKRIYLESGYEKIIQKASLTASEAYFFTFPTEDEIYSSQLAFAHWSYFEPWDSYRNYLVAKEYCGLFEQEETNSGTFTNFAQNDQALYALHAYMMYLKFGFGRATQDAGIEIRRGAMSREQAVNLVNLYDGHYPAEFIKQYLEYYQMTQQEFDDVLDKWVNKALFEKQDGRWKSKFIVE